MNTRIAHRLGIALLTSLLMAGGINTSLADNGSAKPSSPPGNMPSMQHNMPSHPGMPPNGYRPPYPYYQPPAWGYRSPFDDPWFRRHDYHDWDPYAEIERMQWEMERFINDTFRRFDIDRNWRHMNAMNGVITPGLDLRDEGDHYVAVVDIPGADKDAINIELKDRTLSISAEQHQENKRTDDKGNIIFQERRSGMFRRMVTLPEPVTAKDMKTEYKDGVLTITIPKKQG